MTTNSIVEGSGLYLLDWPSSGAIPTSYSAGGWTYENEGFAQQTFLGASIKNFSIKGGFGAGTSSVSVSLVEDKYNQSDASGYGVGDDVYHNGARDSFAPPVVGSPVFFKFGKTHATVPEAFTPTLDILYGQHLFRSSRNPLDLKYSSYLMPQAFGPSDEFTFGADGQIDARPEAGNIAPYDTAYFSGVKGGQGLTGSGDNIWINEYRKIYGDDRGRDHLAFGGILQNTNENKSANGGPDYSVNVVDPREILSNVSVILKDYAGSNYGSHNMINVFGFLEYDPSDELNVRLNDSAKKTLLSKIINPDGTVVFVDRVVAENGIEIPLPTGSLGTADVYISTNPVQSMLPDRIAPVFPVTGEGMSRNSEKGMPFYRITQAIEAILGYNGALPQEYQDAFGTEINFRGFKYVVDFTGLPIDLIPSMYNIDFAQTDLLSLCQEVCDATNRDLFVSLLPVINHPYCDWLYAYNQDKIYTRKQQEIVAGIIRIDSIDRSAEPEYGVVKRYLDQLESESGVDITNRDLGYELTNQPVDKFVVGAQEVKMHFFETTNDRDFVDLRKKGFGVPNNQAEKMASQWTLESSLQQQVLPFYGFLGKDAVTIPRGWGSYQQILLDSQSLEANGVDNYYVATEMELRCALVSFERWKTFLLEYSEVYMESTEEDDIIQRGLLNTVAFADDEESQAKAEALGTQVKAGISNNYAVTVPRCVFRSDKDYINERGLPASACSPPFGYPLYYKRAQRIGIHEAGLAKITTQMKKIATDYATTLQRLDAAENVVESFDSDWNDIFSQLNAAGAPTAGAEALDQARKANQQLIGWFEKFKTEAYNRGKEVLKVVEVQDTDVAGGGGVGDGTQVAGNTLEDAQNTTERLEAQLAVLEHTLSQTKQMGKLINRLGERTMENALKVYNFVKSVADKHLGKTFLVKIPKATNLTYGNNIQVAPWGEVLSGPFGFKPEPVNKNPNYYFTQEFQTKLYNLQIASGIYTYGALKNNYDPISDVWKHNYRPNNQGGYFDYYINPQTVLPHQMFGNVNANHRANKQAAAAAIANQMFLPPACKSYLFPVDGTNFYSDNGRVSAYVRFDNSQFLNFKGVPKDSMTQQVVTVDGGFVPDVVHTLDNMDEDKWHSFESAALLKALPKSVAYVKVQVDEKLYMPPKLSTEDTVVFGRYVEDIGAIEPPRRVWNRDECEFEWTISYYEPHWIPHRATGGAGPTDDSDKIPEADRDGDQDLVPWTDFNRSPVTSAIRAGNKKFIGNIVQTDLKSLENDHVYAIVTVPGRITPTIDSRMKDGPHQSYNGTLIKHFLTMDSVKIPQFSKPGWNGNVNINIAGLCSTASLGTAQNAFSAYKAAMEKFSLADPRGTSYTFASPVYPDMVAIPMQSTERCYGPWISSFLNDSEYGYLDSNPRVTRYNNLGGKIEFEKDENLAPWNFGGYGLLNDAGSLKAAFANSLQLFSERGSFAYVGIPRGNSLGKALTNGGPLVTDINVDVGTNGVKTSVKMDLFTPKFGKLKKQHEVLLDRVNRERQKIRDQKNLLIRNHVIQEATSTEYDAIFEQFKFIQTALEVSDSIQRGDTPPNSMIVAHVKSRTDDAITLDGKERVTNNFFTEMSILSPDFINRGLAMLPDRAARDKVTYNSAGGDMGQLFSASSDEKHNNMTNPIETFRPKKNSTDASNGGLYGDQFTGFE